MNSLFYPSLRRTREDWAYQLTSLIVFTYVLIRAIHVDFTYDEAWTVVDFVPQSVYHIFNFTPCDANNHLLNSLAIKFLYSFLPANEFVSRLPNVVALIIYLYYSRKLCKEFLGPQLGIAAFLFLVLNPFALDFFGLARGYGISLGCEMASLYFSCVFFRDNRQRSLNYLLIWAILTVLAGLSTLNYFLALIAVAGIYVLFFQTKNRVKNVISLFAGTVVLVLTIWEPIRKLIESGSLYYGGKTGFYTDTLRSLAKYTLYSQEDSILHTGILDIFLLISGILLFLSFFMKHDARKNQLLLLGILLFSSLAIILQHALFDNLFIIDRTALFFYPLFVLTLFFSLKILETKLRVALIAGLITLPLVINFCIHFNLYKTINWYFDSHTSEVLEKINDEGRKTNTVQNFDYSWPFDKGVYHYYNKKKHPFVKIVKQGYIELNPETDYYLYLGGTLDRIGYKPLEQFIVAAEKDTVLSFKKEKVYLFKNRKFRLP